MRRALLLLALASGCGGTGGEPGKPKLPPAKSEAVHEFEAAVRLMRMGPQNYARALERLETARTIDPNLWEAWYDGGWILHHSHRLELSADAYERANKIHPTHAPCAQALGAVYLEMHRYGDAARVFRNFLNQKGEIPKVAEHAMRIELASALRQDGHLDDAIEELRAVLRAEPRSAGALAGLGLVYGAQGRHELAELVIRKAIAVAPENSPTAAAAWNDLGLVLLKLRRDQEAFAAFEKAAALDPQLAEARFNRAAVYLDCGDYATAAKELARLTDAQPGNVEAWVALGVAERGRGKPEEARRAYDKALALDANAPGALYNVGVLLQDFKKDAASARQYFERFLKAADRGHPKRPDAEKRVAEMTKGAPGAPK